MSSDNPTSSISAKILWDTSTNDSFHAVMFNNNGVWFKYGREVSLNRLKTVIRWISQNVPIKTVKIRPVSEISANGCEYRFVWSSKDILISRQPKRPDEDEFHYRVLSNMEWVSLLGNPSRLLADYWDELYEPPGKHSLYLNWEDEDPDRIPNTKSLGGISLSVANGVFKGSFEQVDEKNGVILHCEWSVLPEIESSIRRALWLGKGNAPEAGQ